MMSIAESILVARVPQKALKQYGKKWPRFENKCPMCEGAGELDDGAMCICSITSNLRAAHTHAAALETPPKLPDNRNDWRTKARREMWQSIFASTPLPRFVVLAGVPGTGKTHAAVKIVSFAWPFAAIVSPVMKSRGYNELDRALKYASYLPILLIDDLGVDTWGSSKRASDFVTTLIAARSMYGLGDLFTIITTNLSLDGIKAAFGERISSRLSKDRSEYNATWAVFTENSIQVVHHDGRKEVFRG